MSTVSYILLENSVNLCYGGKMVTINSNDNRYEPIINAIKNDDMDKIPSLVDVSNTFEGLEGVEYIDGRILLNGMNIPEIVTDRVLRFQKQGLPFEPLIKFSKKLLKNPSFNSRKMLYKFLEHNGHPITKDGNFIAYKKVDHNFKDCHTHSIDNSVGKVVEMERHLVDDNPDNTCSSGLHVAAYKYASNFSSGHLVEVEVNPEDVVAVPNDYNGEKMRVCKYKVVNLCESKLEDVELYDDELLLHGEEIEVGDTVELVSTENTKLRHGYFNGMLEVGETGEVTEISENSVVIYDCFYSIDDLVLIEKGQ